MVVAFSAKQKEQRTPPAANQRQHHHVYVYVSRQLGLIYTYLQYFLINFSEFILSDPHTRRCVVLHFWEVVSRESSEEWEFKFPVSSFEFSQFSKVKSCRNSSLISYDLFTHTDPFAAV